MKSLDYNDVILSTMASQITGVSSVCSTVCSGADQRKLRSSALLAFVRGNHRSPADSPNKGPVMRKMLPFDDVIMWLKHLNRQIHMLYHNYNSKRRSGNYGEEYFFYHLHRISSLRFLNIRKVYLCLLCRRGNERPAAKCSNEYLPVDTEGINRSCVSSSVYFFRSILVLSFRLDVVLILTIGSDRLSLP